VPRFRGVAAVALTALCALAPPALAHEGNPNYRSEVLALPRAVDGLRAQVVNFDDRIELRNESAEVVIVDGYRGEPYLRFLPGGSVEVNRRSPAAYLNEDRFAAVEVPASAQPRAEPQWEQVAENGRYGWHDHRIHWMSKVPPKQVREDEARRVKIFDWRIPVAVGGRSGAITGSLTWLGKDDGGIPVTAVLSLAAALLGGAVLVVAVRRRRRRPTPADRAEAW
jgi:hypothetical protein